MAARFLGWAPRDTAHQLQRLARHTAVVAMSKWALVGLAALLVSLVFIIPALQDDTGGARIVFSNIQEGEAEQPHMSNPHFQGVDGRGQPYVLSAKSAEQQDDGRVMMSDIEADITLANGAWLAFKAERGLYNPDKEMLVLPGTVQVFYDEGYEMRTSKVRIDLKAAAAYGEEQVNAQGPLGTLVAKGFRVDSEKQYIQFIPEVKVKLLPSAKKKK